MTSVDKNDLAGLSFPDREVTEFLVDPSGNLLKLKCLDGYLEKGPEGRTIANVKLQVSKFNSLSIFEFKDEKEKLKLVTD